MASTTTELEPGQWHCVAHRAAMRELHDIPSSDATTIKAIAQEASQLKKPSNHPNISLLRHCSGMMRIRSGNYRALCDRSPPDFRVLLIDRREYVYDRVGEAKARQ